MMCTHGCTSSIIQQYSGTRLTIKKTSAKLSNQHMPVSRIGAQFPALMKTESSPRIQYDREDTVPVEQNKTSQRKSRMGALESHQPHNANYLSQAKTAISDHL